MSKSGYLVVYKLVGCPGCEQYTKKLEPTLAHVAEKLGMKYRVNVARNHAEADQLRQRDGASIAQFPSLAVFRNGRVVTEFVPENGLFTQESLVLWLAVDGTK